MENSPIDGLTAFVLLAMFVVHFCATLTMCFALLSIKRNMTYLTDFVWRIHQAQQAQPQPPKPPQAKSAPARKEIERVPNFPGDN